MKSSNNMMMLGVLALGGLIIWQMTKSKQAVASGPTILPAGATTTAGAITTTASEGASIPLSVWQGLTGEQLAALPVTKETGTAGIKTYYKTSQPVAIGDTGFKIWGMTSYGSVVLAKNDPASYPVSDWLH